MVISALQPSSNSGVVLHDVIACQTETETTWDVNLLGVLAIHHCKRKDMALKAMLLLA